jgi:lipoate-protein ligase A
MIVVLSSYPDHGRGPKLLRLKEAPQFSHREEPFLCFQRRAPGDVLLVSQPDQVLSEAHTQDREGSALGTKILGSAQRRFGGALLQHGSLLLERSAFAPELAGWRDLTGAVVSSGELVTGLADSVAKAFASRLIHCPLPMNLQLIVREFANSKYGAAGWTNRR